MSNAHDCGICMISESYDIAGSHFQKIYKAAK